MASVLFSTPAPRSAAGSLMIALASEPESSMDREPIQDRPMLPRAPCVERILRDVTGRDERRTARHDIGVECIALFDIRLDEELSAGLEEARDLLEERIAHDEALLVALLPPRIGKVEEDATHRVIGAEARKREAGVLAKDPRAISEAMLREALVADGRPLTPYLETDERGLGCRGGAFEEEAGLGARTDLELDPSAGGERSNVDLFTLG